MDFEIFKTIVTDENVVFVCGVIAFYLSMIPKLLETMRDRNCVVIDMRKKKY